MICAQHLPALRPIRFLFASVMFAVTLTSCVAPPKDGKDANGKKIEYVYYTPTGSSIPIRVPKDSIQLTDNEAATQDKLLTDLNRDAPINPPPNTGGK
jgi:hypothetical protein